MRAGDAIGGVSLIALAGLLMVVFVRDDAPPIASLESATSTTAGPTTTSSTTSPITTTISVPESTDAPREPTTTTEAPTTTQAPTTLAPATQAPTTGVPATTTTPDTTTTVPADLPVPARGDIAVLVVNGGNQNGAAGRMSDGLRLENFAPLPPADAHVDVGVTMVLYAAGKATWAAEVNAVVGAAPENVREGDPNDGNWAWYGEGIDVLVVIGPAS